VKSLSSKIARILICALISLLAGYFFYYLSWYPPLRIDLSRVRGEIVTLAITRADGGKVQQLIRRSETGTLSLYAVRLDAIKTDSEEPSTVFVTEDLFSTNSYEFQNELSLPHTGSSFRNQSHILTAIIITSLLIFFILYFFSHGWHKLLWWIRDGQWWLILLLHLAILGIFFYLLFPGIINFDSFVNNKSAAEYGRSAFVGYFYSSILMVLYQLVPHVWVSMVLNLTIILWILMLLYQASRRLNTTRWYLLGCLLFYAYPANNLLTFTAGRDTSSFWIMLLFLTTFYEQALAGEWSFNAKLKLSVLLIVSCLLRQENLYFLPAAGIIYAWMSDKRLLPWALGNLLLVVGLHNVINHNPHQIDFERYKTTLLVNPLGYILKAEYPDGLPDEVNERLGNYFKNETLITKHVNWEIVPFHENGVRPNSSREDYLKFRNAALMIFMENPQLFIANRYVMALHMFGIHPGFTFVTSDQYFQESPFHFTSRRELAYPEYTRPARGESILAATFKLIHQSHPLIWRSYWIPFAILLWLLWRSPRSIFAGICGILIFRTAIIILTSPAGYFKYNYPLWLAAMFLPAFFMAELKRKKN
jgi:hypothetical protein